jgi:hypothetical protein
MPQIPWAMQSSFERPARRYVSEPVTGLATMPARASAKRSAMTPATAALTPAAMEPPRHQHCLAQQQWGWPLGQAQESAREPRSVRVSGAAAQRGPLGGLAQELAGPPGPSS